MRWLLGIPTDVGTAAMAILLNVRMNAGGLLHIITFDDYPKAGAVYCKDNLCWGKENVHPTHGSRNAGHMVRYEKNLYHIYYK